MFWKRLFSFFAPSPGAVTLAWAALIVSVLLSLTVTVISISNAEIGSPVLLYSLVAFPPSALLLSIATFLERKPGARFILWAFVMLLVALSVGGFLLAGYMDSTAPFAGTLSLVTCCCLPFLGSLAIVLIFLGRKAYPAFRQVLRAARMQRLLQMVQARGEVLTTDLGAELSLDVGQVESLVRELIADGELMAFYDAEHQRVYSAAALNEKQRILLAMINVKGKASLKSLADELNVGRELVRRWIYALAQRGQLHGFVDWSAGIVYSQEVEPILAQNICPHCGGRLEVAGKGLIQCEHCGVEMFL